jgi:hypothetical protein
LKQPRPHPHAKLELRGPSALGAVRDYKTNRIGVPWIADERVSVLQKDWQQVQSFIKSKDLALTMHDDPDYNQNIWDHTWARLGSTYIEFEKGPPEKASSEGKNAKKSHRSDEKLVPIEYCGLGGSKSFDPVFYVQENVQEYLRGEFGGKWRDQEEDLNKESWKKRFKERTHGIRRATCSWYRDDVYVSDSTWWAFAMCFVTIVVAQIFAIWCESKFGLERKDVKAALNGRAVSGNDDGAVNDGAVNANGQNINTTVNNGGNDGNVQQSNGAASNSARDRLKERLRNYAKNNRGWLVLVGSSVLIFVILVAGYPTDIFSDFVAKIGSSYSMDLAGWGEE